ncbi:NADP-dependent isocitrate dehydrogenase [Roseivirga misakiensis]|uniref:Isocitrate dehydrogenase [NADP] n=1 Tax=Roseivirga misakiensis TaxID=1563681 RepID=A0A1E5T276_9BACT|nr:NADP-dependent isocitrate dehydrogenase [Roseivirga misakiensis]OEK05466.1 isocitrate dehydrogenase [Roseivirga misakiensis]
MSEQSRITVAHGDGIGPEIMDATLRIMNAAEVGLAYDTIEIGEKVYKAGHKSGISPESWQTLRDNKIFLKAPITTPQGGGYKSLNVTIRKSLGLYSNVRPFRAYVPYVPSFFPKMDIVIVRENEEDLYAGIEHQQTSEVVQTLKLISDPGSEKIIRYAFEYARAYGRQKVTCMTKDNIMKHTDGMFHEIFDKIKLEYPEIEADHWIIDIGSAVVAARPETLDVVVTLNLYGDVISDIAAEVAGSVGMSGSSNVGMSHGMFEAIHGSAPDIAGKNIANPSGLLNGATMMLVQLGKADKAELIQNAWLKTLEDGIHTGDIYREGQSVQKVGTKEFADAVIERLGQKPSKLAPVKYNEDVAINVSVAEKPAKKKELVGVDVFIDWREDNRNPDTIGDKLLNVASTENLKLKLISNRGVLVYPNGMEETFKTDHWRCRFTNPDGKILNNSDVIELLLSVQKAGFDFIKTEHLYHFDGERGYSLSQGE